jgi:hypothetical protein
MSQNEPADLDTLVKQVNNDTPSVTITLTTPTPVIASDLLTQLIPCLKEGVSNALRHSNAAIIDISFANDPRRNNRAKLPHQSTKTSKLMVKLAELPAMTPAIGICQFVILPS